MENMMERALGIARGWCGGGEDCVVSHPDAGGPCGRPGTGMVWNLPFCEVHGREAEAAALEELAEDAEMALQGLEDAEKGRANPNPVVVRALRNVQVPVTDARSGYSHNQDEALRTAYPIIEGRANPDTLAFDYEAEYSGDEPGDGPVDWWADTRYLLCRFMREAQGKGLPELVRELEPLRERASAQLVQAEDDLDRRWITLKRRAAKLRAAAES